MKGRAAYGVMGIEERSLEPRAGVAEGAASVAARGGRGVSRSLRNWALFMVCCVCEREWW